MWNYEPDRRISDKTSMFKACGKGISQTVGLLGRAAIAVKTSMSKDRSTVCLGALHVSKDTLPP